MKRLIILLYLGVVAYAKPSHLPYNDIYPIHPGVGAIYKGPNSETIIEGPDGSIITAEADGGAVGIHGEHAVVEAVNHVAVEAVNHAASGVVAQQAIASQVVAQKVSASAGAYVQTNVAANAPIAVARTPILIEEPVIVAAPAPQVVLVDDRDTAALDGPSGSIFRHGEDAVISGPSSTTIKGGKVVLDVPNVELKATVVGSPLVTPLVGPGPIVVSASPPVVPIISVTPAPILIDASPRPLPPRPVLIDTTHPVKALGDPVPVLIDDTYLRGSALGTSDSLLVNDAQLVQKGLILSTPGPILHDSSVVSVQNEIVPQVVVSSTPAPIFPGGGPIVVAPSRHLSPPLKANQEVISAAIAENARAEQAYLSSLQVAEYERHLAAEAERRSFQAAVASSRGYEKALAAEAERKSLEAAIRHSSAGYRGNGLVGVHPNLNPVVSQGNQIISGQHVIASTPVPLGIVPTTPIPALVTSLAPPTLDVLNAGKGALAVGPQVFQANGIISSAAKSQVALAAGLPPAVNLVSSAIPPVVLDHSGPIISRPAAVLGPVPAGLGQVVVQSKTVSASEASSHSSSVQSSSSTITGPVVLGDGHGQRLPGGPPLDYVEWQQRFGKHGFPGSRGLPVHKSFLH